MKKYFLDDLGIKILSVVLAIGLWFYLSIILDPETERVIRGVHVYYTNTLEITNRNLVIIRKDENLSTDITIKGSRNKVHRIIADDIRANVDLAVCNAPGIYDLKVGAILVPSSPDIAVTAISPGSFTLELETKVTKTLPIEVKTEGELGSEYIIGEKTQSESQVKVEGPQSYVDAIDHAVITVDIGNKVDDIVEKAEIDFINASGAEVDKGMIQSGIESVEIKYQVLKKKKVPIEIVYSPKQGKDFKTTEEEIDGEIVETSETLSFSYNPIILGNQEVTILGPKALIDSITKVSTKKIEANTYLEGATFNTPLDLPENVTTEQGDWENVTIQMQRIYD